MGDVMTLREQLEYAWGLATLPMATDQYTQAVLRFLAGDGIDGVCSRALLMFELAIEISRMGGSFDALITAWPRQRSHTEPMTPVAIARRATADLVENKSPTCGAAICGT